MLRKKMCSALCVFLLILMILPFGTTEVFAAGALGYNSEKALSYARSHWNDGKGDCVEFVRACVQAGGIPKESGRTYGYTPKQYKDYLIKNDYAVVYKLSTSNYYSNYQGIYAADNDGKIAPGDIILYRCNNKKCPKPEFHLSISEQEWDLYMHRRHCQDQVH